MGLRARPVLPELAGQPVLKEFKVFRELWAQPAPLAPKGHKV